MPSKRNRWVYAAGAAVACAGVLVGAHIAVAGTASSVPAPAPAPARAAAELAPPSKAAAPNPLGTVVPTGLGASTSGGWLLYAVPIDDKQLPDTHFGLMLGRRLADGTLTGDVMTNETAGPDRAKGFHAGQRAMTVDGGQTPTFGYYVGSAARITTKAHGNTVIARQARWSEDPSVIFYWFSPATSVSSLTAYASNGHVLAAVNDGIGVG